MQKLRDNVIFNAISKALESFYFTPILLAFGFVCWYLEKTSLVLWTFCIAFALVLIFCKDVKNIFTPLFFVAFYLPDIEKHTDYTVYVYGASMAIAVYVIFFVCKLIKDGKNIKTGKFTFGLLISFVAYLLGGIIGQFKITNTLMILGFCVAIFTFYIVCLNYTENLQDYFEKLFITASFFLGYQLLHPHLVEGVSGFVSTMGPNTTSLYVMVGVVACFARALRSKKDYIYFFLVIVFSIFVVASRCRMAMLLTAIIDVVFSVMLFIKSKNKYALVIIEALSIAVVSLCLAYSQAVRDFLIKVITGKQGLSGREELWGFCFGLFVEHPLFGNGYLYYGDYPLIRVQFGLIMAHNTLLQWLACSGFVGLILMMIFYREKYHLLFDNFNANRIFVMVSVLAIEASGIMDQAAAVDPFLPIVVIMLMACVEKEKPTVKLPNKELLETANFD